jgi:hypothetical protein
MHRVSVLPPILSVRQALGHHPSLTNTVSNSLVGDGKHTVPGAAGRVFHPYAPTIWSVQSQSVCTPRAAHHQPHLHTLPGPVHRCGKAAAGGQGPCGGVRCVQGLAIVLSGVGELLLRQGWWTMQCAVAEGAAFTLKVTAAGAPPLSFQWARGGTLVGSNSSTLYVAKATVGHMYVVSRSGFAVPRLSSVW